MNLYEKRFKYQEALREAEKYDIEIQKASQRLENLKKDKKKKQDEAASISSDLTVILFEYSNASQPWITMGVCYDVDLGRLRHAVIKDNLFSSKQGDNCDFVDLSGFFMRCYNGLMAHRYSPMKGAFTTHISILNLILEDMFAKKQYENWDEVKKDLKNLEEYYTLPLTHETPNNYQERVLNKVH